MVRPKTKSAPASVSTQLPFGSVNTNLDENAAIRTSKDLDDSYLPRSSSQGPAATAHLVKAEHANSRAARRGPMDEMRQLIRILAKLMPQSERFLRLGGEDSGGNRVSEEQIRAYLATSLEGAPQPKWGLPEGWGQYLADLFNWALKDDVITAEQARRCAKRGTGRPWEAVWSQVYCLGVFPDKWPVPLQRAGVDEAQMMALQNPAVGCQPPPNLPMASHSGKRSGSDEAPAACKRQKVTAQSTMRPAGLPTAISNIGTSAHGSAAPSPGSLCTWHSDALLKNILNSINELQERSESERGSVAQQAEVFAALLHLMPQVGRQVSGGHITAPPGSHSHHALLAQHAKLVMRQEQLLQYQQRVLLSQGNPAGRLSLPPGGIDAAPQGGSRPGGASQQDGGKGVAGDAGKSSGGQGMQDPTQEEPFTSSQMAFVHSLQENQSQDPLLFFSQGNLDPLSQSLPMLQTELSGPDIMSQDFKAGPFSQELRHLQLSQNVFPSQPEFTFSQPVGSQAGAVVAASTEQQGVDKGAAEVA
eukprot:jgi/Ulvmu1/7497/UM037_0041.1